jgi:D-glycero-alpha-D-manno-heptose-7-phosphate kinase
LISEDTGEQVDAADPATLPLDRLPLVARLVRYFGARGVDVRTRSGSPVGAGLGGSSAMNIAVAGALSAWTGRNLPEDQLLTLAMNIEAQVIRVPTGVQDYRPALYGGVSALEMDLMGVHRVPIPVDLEEFERRIVLAYTGASRESGINNWDVMVRRMKGDAIVIEAFDQIRDAARDLREAFERADWAAAGTAIAAEWQARRRLGAGVSTREIDQLIERARMAGALAGKVCGAGGGGCVFCLVEPAQRADVADALASAGATVLPVTLEREGLRISRDPAAA